MARLSVPPEVDNDEMVWEIFHENSKLTRYDRPPSNTAVRSRMAKLSLSLPYEGYPAVALPSATRLHAPVGEVMKRRVTARSLQSCSLNLSDLTALFEFAYGETRDNVGTEFPRPFRVIPSGGALYPLELYIHSARIIDTPPGLYHYNPTDRKLRLVKRGDHSHKLCNMLVQNDLPLNSAAITFVTAFFERSIFKYGNRGYRFVLLEAGHLAQNLNIAATALGLGVVNIGGFFDREVDTFLELDGLTRSTVYLQAIGRPQSAEALAEW